MTRENARAVARICLELDGIPLAIELSTARMGALAVEQVAERLEDSIKLLTGGVRTLAHRHQTLRATLDWSYELLSQPERVLFRRLSVFVGGWTLEAAEAVGAGDGIEGGDVLDLLSGLVNKSMVVVGPSGGEGLRYGMLEPVRRYGQDRLGQSAEAVRRRHAYWYFELAKEVEPWLRGARQVVWLEQLETEYGNLRTALSWALERGEIDLGLWFGAALGESWYMSGNLSEGRRWLEAALAKSDDAPPTPARTKALLRAGWIAWEQGDYEGSVALSEESLILSRAFGDEAGTVAALSNLGWAALLVDDLGRASALAEKAAALGRALDDTGGIARTLLIPGLTAVAGGDYERAIARREPGAGPKSGRRRGCRYLARDGCIRVPRPGRCQAREGALWAGPRATAPTQGDERDRVPAACICRSGRLARASGTLGQAVGSSGVDARDHRCHPLTRRDPRPRTLYRSRPQEARRGRVGKGLG